MFPLLATTAAAQADPSGRVGLPEDWSHRHVVFGRVPSRPMPAAAKVDPRFWQQEARRNLARSAKDKVKLHGRKRRVDWSVNLGGAGSRLAAGTFPAKYTFDINASPSCVNDFVVFALNIAGSGSQATIVAYNNLYSGPGPGPGGLCDMAAPTVKWAYNTGEAINTSPILSLNGKKVAWVSNASPQPILHVLAIGTTGSNGTSVTAPAVPGAGNNAVEVEVPYGATGNTRSSIFVDYRNDVAYVASDDGFIHKFTGIFLGTPTEVSGGGTGWPIQNLDLAARVLTSVVFDSVSGNLFYGMSNGKFGYIREVGSTRGACEAAGTPPCRGLSSKSIGGGVNPIVDAPIVDSGTQNVFVFVGSDGVNARALQTDTQLSTSDRQATLGQAGQPLFAGTFDADYYTSAPSGFLYVCGYTAGGAANPVLYRLGFNGAAKMNLAVDGSSVTLSNAGAATRCSPLTEVFNPPTLKDWLFVSVTNGCLVGSAGTGGCIMSFDITPAAMPVAASFGRAAAGGTSGIVVDNVSTSSQASSIYFSTQADGTCASDSISTGGCAVKLTQSGLN